MCLEKFVLNDKLFIFIKYKQFFFNENEFKSKYKNIKQCNLYSKTNIKLLF